MLRALLAIFRPLHIIAKELTTIRELYELELSERYVPDQSKHLPLIRITEKPKKGDVEVTYQGQTVGPNWKQMPDWLEGDNEDFPDGTQS